MVKIAIQGHPTRGKEVIQILESLGGKNVEGLKGTYESFYYVDDKNEICDDHKHNFPTIYQLYTLEEFKKVFPFKIGDIVFYKGNKAIVEKFIPRKHCYYIRYNNPPINGCYTKWTTAVELKMKEERNITLTLNKAKEWYNKDGELKEVALTAYSEKELIKVDLPKTWEEFCENHPIKETEAIICYDATITDCSELERKRDSIIDKDVYPSKKSAEAHLALIQLEQLRDCYRQGDIPNFNDYTKKYCIIKVKNHIDIIYSYGHSYFLSFTKKEIAEKFLNNFKLLIKIAEDYI